MRPLARALLWLPERCHDWLSVRAFSSNPRATLNNYILKLYVSGTSPRAKTAIANLQRICEEELKGQYTLEIIDVLQHPEAAETDRILATPTLVKQLPPPLRRVIGDLSDKEKVLLGLEVHPRDSERQKPRK